MKKNQVAATLNHFSPQRGMINNSPYRDNWDLLAKTFCFFSLIPITDFISSLLHFILSTCMLCIYGNALFFFGTNVAMCI